MNLIGRTALIAGGADVNAMDAYITQSPVGCGVSSPQPTVRWAAVLLTCLEGSALAARLQAMLK